MKKVIMPTPFRMPDDLKAWLKVQADNNRRSLNSEMLVRMEESKRRQENAAA